MTTLLWFIAAFLIALFLANIARIFLKKRTMLWLFILLETQKLTKVIDNLAIKYKTPLTYLANFGIVMGFGPFGVDYLVKEKVNAQKRYFLFFGSVAVFTILAYFLAGALLFNNPLVPKFIIYFIIALTGLMGLSGFILGSLIFSAYDIIAKMFVGKTACPGVGLVLPGVKVPKTNFFIPWYGWIILISAAFIHEFSHGIMLRVAKIKLKSVGVMLFGILPLGAFVEPDEEKLKKTDKRKVLQMYGAGPGSNLLIAIVFLVVLLLIAAPINNYTAAIDNQRELGLTVSEVTPNSEICGTTFENPAYGKLVKNDMILQVNGRNIQTKSDLSKAVKKGEDNIFVVNNLDTNLTRAETITTNELGNIGITAEVKIDETKPLPADYSAYKILYQIIFWIVMLNFILATTNFLPTIPFDGGFMAQIIFSGYLNPKDDEEKRMKYVKRFFGYSILFLILLNIIPYFL
ncbi:MAG: site-2 protease family protein [archaeon]|jgi:membrane-associated protease RseP (regulator of RpoE activity)